VKETLPNGKELLHKANDVAKEEISNLDSQSLD
jgi:hypothetical protein